MDATMLKIRDRFISVLLFSCVLNLLWFQKGEAFSIVDKISDPNNNPHNGSKLILKCISNSPYEHCTWRHDMNVCRFDWNKKHNAVRNQRCAALGNRAIFMGNYDTQECSIELNNDEPSDSGRWICEMRPKNGRAKSDNIDIRVIPSSKLIAPTIPTATRNSIIQRKLALAKATQAASNPTNINIDQSNLHLKGPNTVHKPTTQKNAISALNQKPPNLPPSITSAKNIGSNRGSRGLGNLKLRKNYKKLNYYFMGLGLP